MFKLCYFHRSILLILGLLMGSANASLITDISGLGINVKNLGVSTIGGVVVDLRGSNGTHVVSQLAASDLFVGFYDSGTPVGYQGNPGTIGIQTGFSAGLLGALGGGLSGVSVRFTLFDGDTGSTGFDFNDNTLLLNGLDFGNWSNVNAENTDSSGNIIGPASGGGFRDSLLDTGWFTTTANATLLNDLWTSLNSVNSITFQVQDVDPFDNFYDFTLGIDQSLVNVGQGPTTTPGTPVPEPGPLAMLSLGLGMVLLMRRRNSQN